jgi:hypothetical protein
MREAISAWHSRHLNAGFPVEISWQAAQSVMPLRDRCARDSGPGEIWAVPGIEIHKTHTTIHPRSFRLAKVTVSGVTQVSRTVTVASPPLMAEVRNSPALPATK